MRTLTIDQALAQYRQKTGPVNADKNVAIVRRWLEWGGRPHDASLTAYMRQLQDRDLKPGTIHHQAQVIRAFYRHLGITPPRLVGLGFDPMQDTARPALALDALQSLWQAAADPDSLLDDYQRAILAMVLVYGPRANELAAIRPQDIEADRVYIRTSKGGVPRWIWTPPVIRPLLDIDWPTTSVKAVEEQFGVIWTLVWETERPQRVAWHAARRGLALALSEAGVSDTAIEQFMRWKAGWKQSMVALYTNPNQIVGAQGSAPRVTRATGTYAEDSAVWERHPVIPDEG